MLPPNEPVDYITKITRDIISCLNETQNQTEIQEIDIFMTEAKTETEKARLRLH